MFRKAQKHTVKWVKTVLWKIQTEPSSKKKKKKTPNETKHFKTIPSSTDSKMKHLNLNVTAEFLRCYIVTMIQTQRPEFSLYRVLVCV